MLPDIGLPVVLMVSGGADSTAMAHLLPQLYPQHRYTVLHVNHGLRGEQSDADEQFVLVLAAELGLPCVVRRIDVPAILQTKGGNSEQIGREQRYLAAQTLLAELEASTGQAGFIATAHTADDNAETFLMRVIKGGGSASLSAIQAVRDNIIRPMIEVRHHELTDWLRTNNLSWREDLTNNDTDYLRAFVRHELIPLMQTRNPRLVETINRTTNILAVEADLLETAAEMPGDAADSEAFFDTLSSHVALQRIRIRRAFEQSGGETRALTFEQTELLRSNASTPGFAVDLPCAVSARSDNGKLKFSRRRPDEPGEPFAARLLPNEPLATPAGELLLTLLDDPAFFADPVAYAKGHADQDRLICDADVLFGSWSDGEPDCDSGFSPGFFVSSVASGDRFCPLGMNGQSRLVSDLLIDRKIARQRRASVCKLTIGSPEGDIVWIIGVQSDDRFKVVPETRHAFSIIRRFDK